ncbi:hypothetical protein [Streptomyces canus]|uniref:hypothetical protein n=1 Tax=Streptomyces canus TaxID=58343 RepID=UPI0038304A94
MRFGRVEAAEEFVQSDHEGGAPSGGRGRQLVGDLRFERGDALVGEPRVVPGGSETLGEAVPLGGQGPDLALQGDVGGGDANDVGIRPFALQASDLPQELGDAFSLVDDLRVGVLESLLGVKASSHLVSLR